MKPSVITQYYIATLLLLSSLVACQPTHLGKELSLGKEGEWITLQVSPSILSFGENTPLKATTTEPQIEQLTFFVFDHSSANSTTLLYISPAERATGNLYKVRLRQSNQPLVLHVVANYEGTLDESTWTDKDEGEVITQLQGSGYYFWQRIEVTGISSGSMSSPIQLIRSFSKVSLELAPSAGITDASIKVFNTADIGTVAPYNTEELSFDEEILTTAPETTYGKTDNYDDTFYLQESPNSEEHPIFIILKGRYQGAINYYKIDLSERLVGAKPEKQLRKLNLKRNHHYRIKINAVQRSGAKSEVEAVKGLAINSSAIDYALDAFPAIYSADGRRSLSVEQTVYNVGVQTAYINPRFSYKEDGKEQNLKVDVRVIEENPTQPVVDLINEDFKKSGILNITLNPLPNGKATRRARVLLEVNQGGELMLRSIQIIQYAPFSLEPALINGQNPDFITVGSSVANLSFVIPDDYPSHLYPIPVQIHTHTLTPLSKNLPLSVVNGDIIYTYTVNSPGKHEIRFEVNKSNASEAIRLTAPNFYPATTGYNLGRFTGDITYSDQNSPSKPLPYSLGDLITTTKGRINMPNRTPGRYEIYLPISLLETTTPTTDSITVTGKVIEQVPGQKPIIRIYSKKIPIEVYRIAYQTNKEDPNEVDIDLSHSSTLLHTSLTGINYSGATETQFPENTEVKATINPGSNKSKEIFADMWGQSALELHIPAEEVTPNTPIEIEVTYPTTNSSAGLIIEKYKKAMTIGQIHDKISLPRTQLTIFGESMVRVAATIYAVEPNYDFQVAKKGELVKRNNAVPRVMVTETKRYRADLSPDTREEDELAFQYRVAATWYGTYKSLSQLRQSSYILLVGGWVRVRME